MLAEHRFADPQHELLFAALSTLRQANPQTIHEQLRARLTNLGFPDVDVTGYLEAPAPGALEVQEALRRLARSGEQELPPVPSKPEI